MRATFVAILLAGSAAPSPTSPRERATAEAVEVAGDLARLPSGQVVSLSRNELLPEWSDLARLRGDRERGCGVRADGGIRCWAPDASGKIVIKAIDGIGTVKDAAGSLIEGCAARNDGAVVCWQRDDPAKEEAAVASDDPPRTPSFDAPAPDPLARPIQIV